ncbi:MAG: SIR2 family protein [Algicola sp.]|nr:SIR2 family protein [Algicola sp.]
MTKLPKSLTVAAEAGTLLPIVGAGVSISIKNKAKKTVFPTWKGLLERAADELDEQSNADQATMVRILLKQSNYQQAADFAYKGLKGTPWTQFFKKQFDPKLASLDMTTADLPKTIWQLSSQIITLNYDRILTWAAQSADISVITNSNKAELADFQKGSNTKPTVWHLHGHVDDCAKIVLTAQGYAKLYATEEHLNSEYEAALQTLKSLSAQRHLLFIGCGMDDADLLAEIKYQQTLFGDNTGPHFALVRQAQLANIQSKIDGDVLKLITYEDFGEPLVKLVKEIASHVKSDKSANPRTTAAKLEDAKPAKIKMAVLTANPINNEQDYSHWLSHFDKIDADIDHFSLTVDHLNNLDEYQYIFILSRVVKDRLLIEDDYLSSQKLTIEELEEAIYADALNGVFYLLDKLPEAEFTLKHPSLLLTTQDSDLCRKALFELFKKTKFGKIERAVAYNPDQLKLTKCYDIKNGKGIRYNTSPLPLAVDPNNLKGLVGRHNDLENICRKLIDLIRDVGVLTVKGSGGIGKTTLVKKVAYELAQRGYFNKGIHFVDCEFIESIDTFTHQIAAAFNCKYDDEFSASTVRDCDKTERLIILDNLETLLYIDDKDACLALIQSMSNYATVVITTRELSKIEGEDPAYELRQFTPGEAFDYFVQQAKLGDLSDAEAKLLREGIIENLLDNNPLAIKLVTANMPQGKSLASLKADLEDDVFEKTTEDDLHAFDAKSDTNIARKRSIYGSIAYSYKNLSEAEQTALLLLSTFPSGLAIDNLTQVQNWAEKEKMEVDTTVTDRTIRALQNKSMVENHGEVVTLQSIVGKFAERKLASHPAKDSLMLDAFRFQEVLVLCIDMILNVDRRIALYMADNMLATLVKSIELCGLVKRNSSDGMSHIARAFKLIGAIGELPALKSQLQKCITLFDGEYRELIQIWIEGISLSTNKRENFDALKNNVTCQFSYFVKDLIDLNMGTMVIDAIFDISSLLAIDLPEHMKTMNPSKDQSSSIGLFFFHGAFNAQIANNLISRSTADIEIKMTFNLELAKNMDKLIQQHHHKDRQRIEHSYIRAKIKPLSKIQITELTSYDRNSAGLKALICTFSETNNDKKESYFKKAIDNLLLAPYRYAEAHYYYAEFLRQQNREEFGAIVKTGIATAEKYHLRYLQYQFDQLRGVTDKPEYDPKDYPLPDGIDLDPYVQKYIEQHGNKDKKSAPKKLTKPGKKKGKKR